MAVMFVKTGFFHPIVYCIRNSLSHLFALCF